MGKEGEEAIESGDGGSEAALEEVLDGFLSGAAVGRRRGRGEVSGGNRGELPSHHRPAAEAEHRRAAAGTAARRRSSAALGMYEEEMAAAGDRSRFDSTTDGEIL